MPTRRVRRVVSTSVLLCLSGIAADAAQEPPPFRSGVAAVELQATVTDASGRPVAGLTPDDFILEVDGKPRPIAVFQAVALPLPARTPSSTRSVPPDVATNAGADDGRVLLIVVDDLQFPPHRGPAARQLTCSFVERYMAAGDQYSIVATSGRTDLLQDFTNDKARVLEACDAITGRQNLTPTTSPQQRLYEFRSSLSVMTGMARRLAAMRGRRLSMLVVSSLNISDHPMTPDWVEYLRATEEAITALRQSNVTVYSLDPQGLFLPAMEPRRGDTLPALPGDRAQGLRMLAEETGGFAAVDTNDFDRAFARIVDDNSTYYVLGFPADGQAEPDRLRNVRVRVRRPGVKVTARRTYIPPSAMKAQAVPGWPPQGVPAPLAAVLSSPVPRSGVEMAAQAVPYAGPTGSTVRLVVEIGATASDTPDEIEIALVTVDGRGRYDNGTMATIDGRPGDGDVRWLKAGGVRWQTDLALKPGTYQIRIAARVASTGREGLVLLDTVVPRRDRKKPAGASGETDAEPVVPMQILSQ